LRTEIEIPANTRGIAAPMTPFRDSQNMPIADRRNPRPPSKDGQIRGFKPERGPFPIFLPHVAGAWLSYLNWCHPAALFTVPKPASECEELMEISHVSSPCAAHLRILSLSLFFFFFLLRNFPILVLLQSLYLLSTESFFPSSFSSFTL
jgi:hypothetical protein